MPPGAHITNATRPRKGKPAARRGRKAYGPRKEVAGLPKRPRHEEQAWDREGEWEPSAVLVGAMEGACLQPKTLWDADIAVLEPHLKEALGELSGLERRRGLSGRERMRAEALGMLLEYIEEIG